MQFIFIRSFNRMPPIDLSKSPENIVLQKTLAAKWMRHFPETVIDDAIDFEDFWEYATQFLSVLEKGHDCWILESPTMLLTPVSHGKPQPEIDGGPLVVMGAFKVGFLPEQMHEKIESMANYPAMAWPVVENVKLAARYAFSETFKKHAGRRVTNAGLPLPPEALMGTSGDSLYDRHCYHSRYHDHQHAVDPVQADSDGLPAYAAIKKYHDTGSRSVFIKVNQNKYQTGIIDLPETLTMDQAKGLLNDFLNYGVVHLEGYSDVIQVQDCVKMRDEYRFVIIDGVPVCGAGTVSIHTPLDADWNRDYSKIVQGSQDDRDRTLHALTDVELSEYIQFAMVFARDMCAENSEMKNYILDVCRIDGRVAAVEVNPGYNFGLYAMNTDTLIDCICEQVLLTHADKFDADAWHAHGPNP